MYTEYDIIDLTIKCEEQMKTQFKFRTVKGLSAKEVKDLMSSSSEQDIDNRFEDVQTDVSDQIKRCNVRKSK